MRKLNINTILDLIYYIPREYEDRSKFTTIKQAIIGEKASLEVEIVGPGQVIRPRRNMSILKVPFQDESGYGFLVWFNQNYLKNKFKVGEKYRVNGKINKMGMELQVMNPVYEKANMHNKIGQIVPLYSLTSGLTNNEIVKIVNNVLKEYLDFVQEILPTEIRGKYNLIGIKEAIRNIHFPSNRTVLEASKRRLIFEELFILQLGLFIIKNKFNEIVEYNFQK